MLYTDGLLKTLQPVRKQQFALLLLWLIVQLVLFILLDIRPVLESKKYIEAGRYFAIHGTFPETRYFFYAITTLTIAAATKLSLGFGTVVIAQLLMNLLATYAFYKALLLQSKSPWPAFITTSLLILFIPYQSWNFYLFTESFFYSGTLLFFSCCIAYSSKLMLQALSLLFCILARPLGILLLPAWIVFVFARHRYDKRATIWLFICITAAIIVFAITANHILGSISDWHILQSAENNSVICDVPVGIPNSYSDLKAREPLVQLVSFIIHHPKAFFSLALKRLLAFFFMIRPYYSALHNIALLVGVALLYVPMVLLPNRKKGTPKSLLTLAVVISFAAAVGLQCDDYHNRFFLPLVPMFLFAGIFNLLQTKQSRHTPPTQRTNSETL